MYLGEVKLNRCILCGKEFEAKNKNAKICYDDHYKTCEICGKKFKVNRNYYKQKTCSSKCSKLLRKKNAENTSLKLYGVKNAGYTEESQNKIKATNLQKYGVECTFQSKEVKEKIVKTNIKKYGVPNVNQNEHIKEKVRKTNLERYGDSCVLGHNSSIRSKIDESNLQKYGTKDPGNLPKNIEKRKKTNLERYGKEWYSQTDDFKEKCKETSMKHWGTEHPMKSDIVKDRQSSAYIQKYGYTSAMKSIRIRSKLHNSVKERYGVDWPCQLPQCIEASGHKISKLNKQFGELLNKNEISFEFEYNIENKSYDFKIIDSNILIELNPTWSHTTENTKFGGLNKSYHKDKTVLAEKYGFRCICIWDWDNWDKLINLLKPKSKIGARKLHIKDVSLSEASKFLNLYHLQGTCKGQNIIVGLYDDENLIQLMSFGKPRYTSKYEYELLRLCTHPNYAVIGGSEKLFKHFCNIYVPNSIVSYCDRSKFSGYVYNKLNFSLDVWNEPSCHWSYGSKHITDNLLRQRGYDQLFGTNYGKGTDNKSLMIKRQWLPVYDCGQARYSWRN